MAKVFEINEIAKMIPERIEDSNKGTYGKVLNIAGSKYYQGAAFLSSYSALKMGAGFVRTACPDIIIPSVSQMAPELTFYPLISTKDGVISETNIINEIEDYDVISIGCGLTTKEDVKKFVINLLLSLQGKKQLVIDADAINILGEYQGNISIKNAVITPHPKELSRILHVDINSILENREKYARIASQTFECITVLKGHNTIIADKDNIYVNPTGSSALAKAGSGDVLTGIISGLIAQHAKPLDAVTAGTFLHGLAGDIAEDDLTSYCVTASDIINYLPFAINEVLYKE
ncbi:MAG: NAD(P)H-hydrate dehydratase [Candidatus Gastranaerophilales bacterium]|nr:NAD(P)H-hydrate dehydratase [Candidatus Gastranaerophilales bacterium]